MKKISQTHMRRRQALEEMPEKDTTKVITYLQKVNLGTEGEGDQVPGRVEEIDLAPETIDLLVEVEEVLQERKAQQDRQIITTILKKNPKQQTKLFPPHAKTEKNINTKNFNFESMSYHSRINKRKGNKGSRLERDFKISEKNKRVANTNANATKAGVGKRNYPRRNYTRSRGNGRGRGRGRGQGRNNRFQSKDLSKTDPVTKNLSPKSTPNKNIDPTELKKLLEKIQRPSLLNDGNRTKICHKFNKYIKMFEKNMIKPKDFRTSFSNLVKTGSNPFFRETNLNFLRNLRDKTPLVKGHTNVWTVPEGVLRSLQSPNFKLYFDIKNGEHLYPTDYRENDSRNIFLKQKLGETFLFNPPLRSG